MEGRRPLAGLAVMGLLLIGVLAVLVAGGVFTDHSTPAGRALRQQAEQVLQHKP